MSETTNLKLFKQDNPTTNTNNFDIEKTLNDNWDKLDENAGTTNKKLESLEKVDSTTNETITAIQEEQTTQNENIEKNAEGIAQNKKDVDEELTKIKKENSLLKSQIPTGTASGNNIHLGDSSNMDFEWKLRGGSRQKTRSGKNKFYGKFTTQVKEGIRLIVNGDDTILINGTNNLGNLVYNSSTFSLKAGTYIASGMPDGTSIYDVYIQFAYFENEEKKYVTANGTKFTLLEDKDNVVCYIGFKQGKTANNIILKPMLREATVKNDEYEAYGVSPSVEFLSEIKNVGDNINLYNKNDTTLILDAPISNNAVGTRASGTYKTVYIPCEPNTSYVVTKKYDETKNRLIVACSTEIPNYSQSVEVLGKDENATELTVVTSNTAKYLLAYVWIIGGSTTVQEMLDSIKIEEGTKATSLSDYNNASIKVTACNKNIATWDNQNILFANTVSNSIDNNIVKAKGEDGAGLLGYSGGIVRILFNKKLELNKEYVVSIKAKLRSVGKWSKETQFMFGDNTKWSYESKILELSLNTYILCTFEIKPRLENEDRLTIYLNGNEVEFDLDTLQIEEGSTASLYMPNQEQTITFPLEEGQKLYEGSYFAKDGIHNMRRQDILIGEESLKNYHSDTSNGFVGFSFMMSNKHKKMLIFCVHI